MAYLAKLDWNSIPCPGHTVRKQIFQIAFLQVAFLAAVLCLAFVAVGRQAAAQGPAKSYEIENKVYQLCGQAIAALNSNDFARARDSMISAAAYDPTSYSASVHFYLGSAYRGLKAYDKAIQEYKVALRFDPSKDDVMYRIAGTYEDMGRSNDAVQWMKKYVDAQKSPASKASAEKIYRDMLSFKNLKEAETLIGRKQMSKAIKLLDEAAKCDPTFFSGAVHGNLCFALGRAGNPQRAVLEGKKALEFDPNSSATVYAIGVAYADLANYNEAISWLRRYISMETNAAERERAEGSIKCLIEDKKQAGDPQNQKADYLEQVKDGGRKLRWAKESLPIKVHISSGSGTFGFRPVFSDYVKRSLDTWSEASGKKIDYTIVADSSKADIKVEWTRESLGAIDDKHVTPAGVTRPTSNSAGYLSHADIKIQTVDPFETNIPVADGVCATVCMHEIGHALGFNGHSTNIKDVMYFRASPQRSCVPTARDRATMARLYADYPALAFKPKLSAGRGIPGEYLPPPAFLPPKVPSKDKPVPPFFLPPPIKQHPALQPPVYVPPPLSHGKGASGNAASGNSPASASKKAPPAPAFLPPPVSGGRKESAPKQVKPPTFIPPPVRR